MVKYIAYVKLTGQNGQPYQKIDFLLDDYFFVQRLDYLQKEWYHQGYHYKIYKYPNGIVETIKYTETFIED